MLEKVSAENHWKWKRQHNVWALEYLSTYMKMPDSKQFIKQFMD